MQHEQSTPLFDNEAGVDQPTENERNLLDLNAADANPMPTAPMAAPEMEACIETSTDNRSRSKRSCSGAPFGCFRLAKDCSGSGKGCNWKTCRELVGYTHLFTDEEADIIIQRHRAENRKKKAAQAAADAAAQEDGRMAPPREDRRE